MYERFSHSEYGDRPPEYFGEAFDRQYCEMILADMAEADTARPRTANSNSQKGSFFKKAGNLLMKSWRSLRPSSVNSAAAKNDPAL